MERSRLVKKERAGERRCEKGEDYPRGYHVVPGPGRDGGSGVHQEHLAQALGRRGGWPVPHIEERVEEVGVGELGRGVVLEDQTEEDAGHAFGQGRGLLQERDGTGALLSAGETRGCKKKQDAREPSSGPSPAGGTTPPGAPTRKYCPRWP